MDIEDFKKDFRKHVAEFGICGHLLNMSTSRTSSEKEEAVEEIYKKLEKWTVEQFKPFIEFPIKVREVKPEELKKVLSNENTKWSDSWEQNQLDLDF